MTARVATGCLRYTSTLYGLMHMLAVKPLRCINTLWLGVYVRYAQQNPLKYGCSGIEYIDITQFITNGFIDQGTHWSYQV